MCVGFKHELPVPHWLPEWLIRKVAKGSGTNCKPENYKAENATDIPLK